MTDQTMTIGRLATAAGVGIETIRYYQRRGLLPLPAPEGGAFRRYSMALVERIRFIKRAQDLGFTLSCVIELLALEDGHDRGAVRAIAAHRLTDIRTKINDLKRMEGVLSHLIHACEDSNGAEPCPIIVTLAGQPATEPAEAH